MALLIQQIASGLATGAIYASLALALVMIFNSTNHINFAQGEMALLSTYLAWTLIAVGLPYWLAFPLTVIASFAFGVLVERLLIRSFHDAPHLIGTHELFVLTVILGLLAILYIFFRFTTLGLAMRAAALNPVSARLVGIRVGWMLALGWGLAGALGAVAGMLVAPIVYLDPNMMIGILLYAFASAMLGGLSNPAGAVAGGLIFGVMENVVGTYLIGHELKLTFALAVVVAVLLVRPAGLFGKVTVKRV
ncbi:MAG: branched-chain amino acid ABC transporter permease [Candidimonas sp.]